MVDICIQIYRYVAIGKPFKNILLLVVNSWLVVKRGCHAMLFVFCLFPKNAAGIFF